MSEQLTTLAKVKAYLNITNTSSDSLLASFIISVSAVVLNYVNRASFAVQAFADVYDGSGKDFMLLRQWPVVEATEVATCGTTIPASPDVTSWPPQAGFVVEDADSAGNGQQRLMLFGYCFPSGRQSVRVTYSAGYRTLDESHVVPGTPNPIEVATALTWLSDIGVTLNGVAMTKVTGTPIAGQYAVNAAGVYTFAAANTAATVLISYSSVPPDVDQAVVESIGESYRRKDRIGIVSMSVGGQESVSYSQKDLSQAVKLALNPFRRITPA